MKADISTASIYSCPKRDYRNGVFQNKANEQKRCKAVILSGLPINFDRKNKYIYEKEAHFPNEKGPSSTRLDDKVTVLSLLQE